MYLCMTRWPRAHLFLEVIAQGIVAGDAFFGVRQHEELLEPHLHIADGVLLLLVPGHVLLVSLRGGEDGLRVRRRAERYVENVGEGVRLGDVLDDVRLLVLGEEDQHREHQLVVLHHERRFVPVGVRVHRRAQLTLSRRTLTHLVPASVQRLANQLLLRFFALLLRVRPESAEQYAPSDLLVPLLLLAQTRLAVGLQLQRVDVVRLVFQNHVAAGQGAGEVVQAGERLGFAVEHLLVARLHKNKGKQ